MDQQFEETIPQIPQPATSEPRHTNISRAMTMLIVLTSLVIITGGGFISYATVIHSIQLHAQATAIVRNLQVTSSPQYIYDQVTSRAPTVNNAFDSQRVFWQNDTTCVFTGDTYHVQLTPETLVPSCLKEDGNYTNFLYQLQMTFIHGSVGGILFRVDKENSQYAFGITDNGQYTFNAVLGHNSDKILLFGRSTAIKIGPNQPNLLAVMARGSTINLYINKQFITSINDESYSSGKIGCLADNLEQSNVDVAFSNAQIWDL